MARLTTPYYLIDETRLQNNLKIIQRVREASGAKSVLALKCFSTWAVFDLMRQYLDGTTSSSLFEARLGYETFGKEVHAYSVGFSAQDIKAVRKFADKVIFNSISQLTAHYDAVRGMKLGLRVNPGISYSHFDLADPARRYTRLGVSDKNEVMKVSPLLTGVMFHFNCENDDLDNFCAAIDFIDQNYGALLEGLEWVSFGGGLYFTKEGYPLNRFCEKLKSFSEKLGVQIYLEPGEAAITECAELVTTVLDVVHNEIDIAIVDASVEAHMLDHLIYRTTPRIAAPEPGPYRMMIAGRTCLAGDIFGEYDLKTRLEIGNEVRIADAAGYTMVKKNWFNGLPMPSIVVRRLDGTVEVVRQFGYQDFKRNLS
ncbi:MAG: carboxynorspermidine decarboxylase [Candidatus Contendobacter sp.]|nr:MAG: carboxynorspermidine decarboxylase [Candidatus Contendobacter sp.]